jgi:bifunctional enzyme CysN/CysC
MSSSALKIMTCGNVDDGKSTLLGRILYESGNIYKDQSEYIQNLTNRYSNLDIDYSLLLDGLLDEKKQGITIDIAFKYFRLNNKEAVFIDSPGHEEYTRNMTNAASFANVALLIFDTSKKLNSQTKNHLRIVNLFPNIQKKIICYNKLDKSGYSQEVFEKRQQELNNFLTKNNIQVNYHIPISALFGDNVLEKSKNISFYHGPTLFELLNEITLKKERVKNNNILPIQFVTKHENKRLYATKNYGKKLSKNQQLINPSTKESVRIKKIYFNDRVVNEISEKNCFIELSKEISLSPGDLLCSPSALQETDSIKCKVFVTSKTGLYQSKRYKFKFLHGDVKGYVSRIENSKQFCSMNEIISLNIEFERKFYLDNFKNNYKFSRFLIIDDTTNDTVGFGYVLHSLDRGYTVVKSRLVKSKHLKQQKVIWFTGLPSSGKTTLANKLGEILETEEIPFYILDGDNIRKELSQDLGFSFSDRVENNRRIAHVAKMLSQAGVVTIVATISPNKEIRENSKDIIGKDNLSLVYLNTPLEICIKRDPKNLYGNKSKKINNITGISQNFDIPENPDVIIDTSKLSIKNCAIEIYKKLIESNM